MCYNSLTYTQIPTASAGTKMRAGLLRPPKMSRKTTTYKAKLTTERLNNFQQNDRDRFRNENTKSRKGDLSGIETTGAGRRRQRILPRKE
jgi:hypothetical protein